MTPAITAAAPTSAYTETFPATNAPVSASGGAPPGRAEAYASAPRFVVS
jgi:hypothetical protein